MSRNVYITGWGIRNSSDSRLLVTRETRKLMRFARKSGRLFLAALTDAVADMDFSEIESEKRSIYYSESLNFSPDEEHRKELLELCCGAPDMEKWLSHIEEEWSAVEVLKEVPDIPVFLAAQFAGCRGESETFVHGTAAGITSLYEAFCAVRDRRCEIAFAGGAAAKAESAEIKRMRAQGFYAEGDYTIREAGAVLVLESEDAMGERHAKPLGKIVSAGLGFSARMCLEKDFDKKSWHKMLEKSSLGEKEKKTYVTGCFSRIYAEQEEEIVRNNFAVAAISDGGKADKGYGFSAQAVLNVIKTLSCRCPSIVTGMDASGHMGWIDILPCAK